MVRPVGARVGATIAVCMLVACDAARARSAGEPADASSSGSGSGSGSSSGSAGSSSGSTPACRPTPWATASAGTGTRVMERLGRGLVALPMGGGEVFVSWRLLGNEAQRTAFNLYRAAGDGAPVLLTAAPLTTVTSFTDPGGDAASPRTYTVKAVVDGVEECAGARVTVAAGAPARRYLPIALAPLASSTGGTYAVLHVYVGDLDGDGAYEYVVKRLDSSRGPIVVDAYRLDGTLLWRVNLGPNVETGNATATSPILVADLDGDGRAEVVMKTGEGTVFGDGTRIGDTDRDGVTDYRSRVATDTYQVLAGPEFVSVLQGTTGRELARDVFIARGKVTDWGDDYGHRMNFIFATVAYLDGVLPSFVISRGYGDLSNPRALTATAWDFRGGKLTQRWTFRAKDHAALLPAGHALSEFHAIRALDVDGDGKDDVSWGGFTVRSDGTLLFSSVLGHGDRFVIADIDPDRPGLEQYAVQQNDATRVGAALTDARTGEVLRTWSVETVQDVGRGEAAAITPGVRGLQTWNSSVAGLWGAGGDPVSAARPWPSLSVWWDGDLLRESLDGIGAQGYNPAIQKWDPAAGSLARLFTLYADGGPYAVVSPYAGRAPLHGADVLGDWREEIVYETADHSELRIYTTTAPTTVRMPTLMHDPVYRNCVNVKGYLQSTQVGFYLGEGMTFPVPQPAITVR